MPTRSPHALIQNSLLAEALANAQIGALLIDPSGRYVAANDYACTLTGYSADEILAVSVGELNPASGLAAQFEQVVAGIREIGHATIERKDGTPLSITYRASRTRVGGVEYVIALVWKRDQRTSSAM